MTDRDTVYFENHQWRVTEVGLECVGSAEHIEIEANSLSHHIEINGRNILESFLYVTSKREINLALFLEAFDKAIEYHDGKFQPPLNSEIMKDSINYARALCAGDAEETNKKRPSIRRRRRRRPSGRQTI